MLVTLLRSQVGDLAVFAGDETPAIEAGVG